MDETLHETPDLMQDTEPTLWGLSISRGDQDTSIKEPQSNGRDKTLPLEISYPDLSTTNTSLPSSFYSLTPI